MNRIVIIGNSGSGKSTLAKELSAKTGFPSVHLDQLFWVPGSFSDKRATEIVHAEIEEKKRESAWIVEGVFGELAERFLACAECLIWLDMPWATCRAGLESRGPTKLPHQDTDEALLGHQRLITWAENYWTRTDLRSCEGHGRLFDAFSGTKVRITRREELGTVRQLPEK